MKKLSICISTLNRAKFIDKTINNILPQLSNEVELIVVDGASTDNTELKLKKLQKKTKYLKYFKEEKNSGVDGDYDKAIKYARGEYCWLMTDDDLVHKDAVNNIISKINENNPNLIIINSAVKNLQMNKYLDKNILKFDKDQFFENVDKNFFLKLCKYLTFIGCVVIKRKVWLSRDRKIFFGTTFIHVGVILQSPPLKKIIVISKPLINIRYGNAMWSSNSFKVWNLMWPSLVWSFTNFNEKDKEKICRKKPYLRLSTLAYYRAMGTTSFNSLKKLNLENLNLSFKLKFYFINLIPGTVLNLFFLIYFKNFRSYEKVAIFELIHSRYSTKFNLFLSKMLSFN